MDRKLKKQIIKSVVWSVALYGSETWTMRKKEVERIQAFEMWIWRKMEKISWRDRMSNEKVLGLVKEKRSIMNIITERKKRWIGHILRGNGLLREVTEGRMIGKRPRGRKRAMMLDNLRGGINYDELKSKAQNREVWRNYMPKTCQLADNQ